jgi:hypothetical protein
MVENTATNNNAIPFGDAVKLRFLSITIIIIPIKEIKIPNILNFVIFSFNKKVAKIGVITGIVAIITDAIVDETSCNPKFSPRKYNNGSNNAESINNLKCFCEMGCNNPINFKTINNMTEDITNRNKTVVMGP